MPCAGADYGRSRRASRPPVHIGCEAAVRRRWRRLRFAIHRRSSAIGKVSGASRLLDARVENGTGKSRPDRLRLPFKPTVNRFREKMGKWENKTGKRAGTGTETVGVFSRPFSRFSFLAGKIPAGIPVFVVVDCVTCVGNVNCCLHVLQREL